MLHWTLIIYNSSNFNLGILREASASVEVAEAQLEGRRRQRPPQRRKGGSGTAALAVWENRVSSGTTSADDIVRSGFADA